jgi:hypothetical protein
MRERTVVTRLRGGTKYLYTHTARLATAGKQCEVDGILHTCLHTKWRRPTDDSTNELASNEYSTALWLCSMNAVHFAVIARLSVYGI